MKTELLTSLIQTHKRGNGEVYLFQHSLANDEPFRIEWFSAH
jgi:hypothetical protein